MLKRFWYWFWGKPCDHDWDVNKITMTTFSCDPWSGKRIEGTEGSYSRVTRFCRKCEAYHKYKL